MFRVVTNCVGVLGGLMLKSTLGIGTLLSFIVSSRSAANDKCIECKKIQITTILYLKTCHT